jgi:hypothetical protein
VKPAKDPKPGDVLVFADDDIKRMSKKGVPIGGPDWHTLLVIYVDVRNMRRRRPLGRPFYNVMMLTDTMEIITRDQVWVENYWLKVN